MELKIKTKDRTLKPLGFIGSAECFKFDGRMYIKTSEQDPDGDIQALDVITGDIHRFPDDTEVEPWDMVLCEVEE